MSNNNLYGAQESNPLPAGFHEEKAEMTVPWTDARLARIERLRLLSDPGYPAWDVSYCTGRLTDGRKVNVGLPFSELPRGRAKPGERLGAMRKALAYYAKRDGVDLRKLRAVEAISTLV